MTRLVSILVVNGENKILALRRSSQAFWYPGKWDIIIGKVKDSETPDDCFQRKIAEEIGVADYILAEKGNPFPHQEGAFKWFVFPYLCKIDKEEVRLNGDHEEFKWCTLGQFWNLDYAPPLKTAFKTFANFFLLQG